LNFTVLVIKTAPQTKALAVRQLFIQPGTVKTQKRRPAAFILNIYFGCPRSAKADPVAGYYRNFGADWPGLKFTNGDIDRPVFPIAGVVAEQTRCILYAQPRKFWNHARGQCPELRLTAR